MLIDPCEPVSGSIIGKEVGALGPEGVHKPQSVGARSKMNPAIHCPVGDLIMDFPRSSRPDILGIIHTSYFSFVAGKLAHLFNDPSQIPLADSAVLSFCHPDTVHYNGCDCAHPVKSFTTRLTFDESCKQFSRIHTFHLITSVYSLSLKFVNTGIFCPRANMKGAMICLKAAARIRKHPQSRQSSTLGVLFTWPFFTYRELQALRL